MAETENTIRNQTLKENKKTKLNYNEQIRLLGLEPVEYGKRKFIEKVEQQSWSDVLDETVCESDNIEIEEKRFTNELYESNDTDFKLDEKDIEETIVDDNIMITLNIDKVPYNQKPDKKQVGIIQKRIGECKTDVTVEEFIQDLECGMSFKAAALKGNKNADWESQQVFALDIDNDDASIKKYGLLTPEEACKRFSDLGIPPAFYYETFSSTEERPKFRLIFIVRNPVKDIRIRNAIQLALMTIMPEADKACKDLSRLFFGTNKQCKIIHNKIQLLDPYVLIQSMVSWIKAKDSKSKNDTKHIKAYCERVGLNMINGLPNVQIKLDEKNYGNSASSIIYNIENAVNPYKNIVFDFCIDEKQAYTITKECKGKKNLKRVKITSEKIKYKELIRNFPFHELETNKCRLWNDFITGNRWCYHQEVFGIACNMWRVEGAEQKMLNIIISNPKYKDKDNKIYTVKQCNKYGYAPMRCTNFCPYYDSCSNQGLNMLQALDNKRGQVRKLKEDTEAISLEKAASSMQKVILEAINDKSKDIYVAVGGAGVGKTNILKCLPNYSGLGISYPNHRLGIDIVERLNIKDAVHMKELHLEDEAVLKEFRRLQSIGAYSHARSYLKDYCDKLAKKAICGLADKSKVDNIIENINEYFELLEKSATTKGTVFCTHKRMLELNNPNIHTYIIDEDILMSSLIQTVNLAIDQLESFIWLAQKVSANVTRQQLIMLKEKVIESIENTDKVIRVPKIEINNTEINKIILSEKNTLNVNLKEILETKVVISNDKREVLGMRLEKLPDKKCIILSATANERIYRSVLSDREIKYVDIGEIETIGKLVLHYSAFSRRSLKNDFDRRIEQINKEANGINNVITFAKYEEYFREAGFNVIAHFGACSGLDGYKGEDLIVAGTPHVDERVYLLLAAIIDETMEVKQNLEYRNVRRNGFEFYFNTYEESSLLQEIQFYYIESELIQAVGRARILRTDATVHLFSNYPLKGAIMYNA